MKALLIAATLLALGAVLAEGTAEVGGDLQKRQDNSDPCGSAEVDNCQQALNSDDNDRFCDGDCEEVLTDYYHCKGFAEFRLYRDQECGAMATGLGPLLLVTALLVALAAIIY